ncbi:vWA domain-containing protein [Shewanella gaetbuli]
MIHFIRPEWLLGLLPLLILSGLFWKRHQHHSAWKQYIAPHLSAMLISNSQDHKSQPKWILSFCWIVAVVALAGPAVTKQNLPVFATEQGRVLIMDMSYSMYATDLSPNRLSHARFRATDLLAEIDQGETGLIAYAGDAFNISPLTRDTSTLLNLLPTLSPDIMPVRGSNLSSAIKLAEELLAQGGHVTGDIILFTDGVSDNEFNQVYPTLENSRYRLSILAFGSQSGAPIKLSDGQLLRDSNNEVVVAQTDINLLQRLAKQGGGITVAAQTDGSDIQQLTQWLASDGKAKATELESEAWQDLGPYIAILLILPVLMSFKHGVLPSMLVPTISLPLAGLIALMALTASVSQPAQADIWDDLWLTKDQQAQQAFNQGDYEQASQLFSSSNWQASAHYKNKDYQQALTLFEQDNSPEGVYNQANSLLQLGKLPDAIERYKQALSQKPDFTEAQENLALAEKLLEQQNQQQQNQQSDQQNNGQSSDQENTEQQSSEQNSSDQNGSDQNSSEQQNDSSQTDEQQRQSEQQNQSNDNESQSQQQSEQESQQNQQQSDSDKSQDEPDDNSASPDEAQNESNDTSQQQSSADESNNDKDNEPLNNDAQMEANTQQNNQGTQQEAEQQSEANSAMTQQAQQAEQTDEQGQEGDQQVVSPTMAGQEPLPENMERALRAINEDPQVLIRNKMQLEYQKRRQQGQQVKESEQW